MKVKTRIEHRRSQRVTLTVPVVVSDSESSANPTVEDTFALAVNKHGGLIAMRANVARGQKLTLFNKATAERKECHVVYLGPAQVGKRQVGIEFAEPLTDFWKVSFPAPGSKPIPE